MTALDSTESTADHAQHSPPQQPLLITLARLRAASAVAWCRWSRVISTANSCSSSSAWGVKRVAGHNNPAGGMTAGCAVSMAVSCCAVRLGGRGVPTFLTAGARRHGHEELAMGARLGRAEHILGRLCTHRLVLAVRHQRVRLRDRKSGDGRDIACTPQVVQGLAPSASTDSDSCTKVEYPVLPW